MRKCSNFSKCLLRFLWTARCFLRCPCFAGAENDRFSGGFLYNFVVFRLNTSYFTCYFHNIIIAHSFHGHRHDQRRHKNHGTYYNSANIFTYTIIITTHLINNSNGNGNAWAAGIHAILKYELIYSYQLLLVTWNRVFFKSHIIPTHRWALYTGPTPQHCNVYYFALFYVKLYVCVGKCNK